MSQPNPKLLKQYIDSLVAKLIEVGLSDDQNASILSQTSAKSFEVTFVNAKAVSAALKDREYEDVYQEMVDARAYNLKMLDGAIVQMMYEFEDGVLLRHRLAFFPSPRLRPFQEDAEAYLEDALFAEIVSRRIVPFPLRFDFDAREGVFEPLIHPKSHLTLGQYEDCRIPVTSPLTPKWFIDFILRNFYFLSYRSFADQLPRQAIRFEDSIVTVERSVLHVSTPLAGAA